jgi:hypothetical protein
LVKVDNNFKRLCNEGVKKPMGDLKDIFDGIKNICLSGLILLFERLKKISQIAFQKLKSKTGHPPKPHLV